MRLAAAAEMRDIDRLATEQYGLPGLVLMENAGSAVARETEKHLGELAKCKICILAGKGNNGGDGFVAARHLVNGGAKVKVCLLGEKKSLQGDPLTYSNVLTAMGVEILEIRGERDWDKVRIAVTFADCIIDALTGTGYKGEVSANLALAIDVINRSGKKVIAVDIPSGVDADNGQVRGAAVRASLTVTFGVPKPGLVLYPGREHAGKVVVDAIGLPAPLLATAPLRQRLLTAAHVKRILPIRRGDAHKGTNGHAGIVAGSQSYPGAAVLCASGALRSGAGLVTLAVGGSLRSLIQAKVTEIMVRPLPDSGGCLGAKAPAAVSELAPLWDVLAIGPGLGRHDDTAAAVRTMIRDADKPLVIDADAINALAGHGDILQETEALAILTPHPGELSRLTGLTAAFINQDRIGTARQTARQLNCILILKGAPTVIAFPDGEVFLNTTGNAGLATGGTGDVLTGVIAGLIAQGLASHDAALVGVYLHGLAGDLAARIGMVGITAGDVIQALPAAIAGLKQEE